MARAGGGGVGSSHVCQAVAAAAAALTRLHRLPSFLPLPRPVPQVLQPWTEPACIQEGELRGAPASADWPAAWARPLQRLRRRLGAGCSAIVTAAPERARKDGGVTFLCSVWDTPLEPHSPFPSGDRVPELLVGEGEDNSCMRFGNFYCQRHFNFSSAQLSTSLQCRK